MSEYFKEDCKLLIGVVVPFYTVAASSNFKVRKRYKSVPALPEFSLHRGELCRRQQLDFSVIIHAKA
jgi:hypothetical protein